MVNLPILFNGDYQQVVGSISLSDELLEVYSKSDRNHLMINPMMHKQPGKDQEVVAFCVYPMPYEPKPEKKKRGRTKKT